MKTYIVRGWINGSDYDEKKTADYAVKVRAKDEGEADDKGDRKIKREHGECSVIVSEEQN